MTAGPLRFSHLRTLGTRSPAHYAADLDLDDTPSMERGSAAHAVMFGTMRVLENPFKQRRGEAYEEWATANADALVLTASDYDKTMGMVESLRKHELAVKALTGRYEHTILWQHEGVECRSTPDCYVWERLSELKTSRSSQPERFIPHAIRMGYPGQLAFYDEALRQTKLACPSEHLIVVAEDSAPYVVTVFRLTDRALEAGAKQWRGWFEQYRVHKDANVWPGYSQGVVEFDVDPPYEMTFADDGETLEEVS